MKYCSQCGASVEDGAGFCSGCGRSATGGPLTGGSLTGGSGTAGRFWTGVAASIVGVAVVFGLLWATMGANSADPERGQPVASASESETPPLADASRPLTADAGNRTSPEPRARPEPPPKEDVVIEEPGFVGRLLGEKPRVFVTVSEGQTLALELRDLISTETASSGDRFTALLAHSVVVEGRDALPEGTLVSGHVAHAQRSDKVKGRAQLVLEIDSLELSSGEDYGIDADPIRFEASSTKKDDAVKIGGASGVGALVGGLIGGKKGAAIGAGVGAGAGTGVVLTTRGDELVLAEGAQLSTVLRTEITVELIENDEP